MRGQAFAVEEMAITFPWQEGALPSVGGTEDQSGQDVVGQAVSGSQVMQGHVVMVEFGLYSKPDGSQWKV